MIGDFIEWSLYALGKVILATTGIILVALVVGRFCRGAIHDDASRLERGVRDGRVFRDSGATRTAWPERDDEAGAA